MASWFRQICGKVEIGPELDAGFTLIEALIALAILALSLAALLPTGTQALHNLRFADGETQVLIEVENFMALLEADGRLTPGTSAGQFASGARWELLVKEREPATPKAVPGILVYRIVLDVTWGEVADLHPLHFETLRLKPAGEYRHAQ
jgi:general secretion pathway protein I